DRDSSTGPRNRMLRVVSPKLRGAMVGALLGGFARAGSPDAGGLWVVPFVWVPPGADPAAYQMPDPEDQPRLVMSGRVTAGGSYPVVVALHGQPKRGAAPHHYAFAPAVIEAARGLVDRGEVPPFILALPVFRYQGTNWPGFDLSAFREK